MLVLPPPQKQAGNQQRIYDWMLLITFLKVTLNLTL
jgi:hypothetical protein